MVAQDAFYSVQLVFLTSCPTAQADLFSRKMLWSVTADLVGFTSYFGQKPQSATNPMSFRPEFGSLRSSFCFLKEQFLSVDVEVKDWAVD